MRPIQPLVRLPHSHIDPNWLSTVERASRTPPREFYEWLADHILSVTGSLPGSRLVETWPKLSRSPACLLCEPHVALMLRGFNLSLPVCPWLWSGAESFVRPVIGCCRAGQLENEIMSLVIPSAARNPSWFSARHGEKRREIPRAKGRPSE
jgi:hypothetical protein